MDTHHGRAFIGIVPFFMQRIRPAWLPPVPWLSWFLELNVRTYVHDTNGRPGVYFFSLDCNQPLAVHLARRFFHLPYFSAAMRAKHVGNEVRYACRRRGDQTLSEYHWESSSSLHEAEPGSLEFFLVERYLLFTGRGDGQLVSGQVHHLPYRIGPVAVKNFSAHPATLAGFVLKDPMIAPICASAVDVEVFAVQRV